MEMERTMATSADAEIILKLYELRREEVMRRARAWMSDEFWPETAEEFFAVADNPKDEHNAWFRQVSSYWEMAAAMVLHGALSADLFVDCNGESFYHLAKFSPILDEIRAKKPSFMAKTSDLISRYQCAATRYAGVKKGVDAAWARRKAAK